MISYFKNASSNFFFIVGVDVEKVDFLTSLFQAHRLRKTMWVGKNSEGVG